MKIQRAVYKTSPFLFIINFQRLAKSGSVEPLPLMQEKHPQKFDKQI